MCHVLPWSRTFANIAIVLVCVYQVLDLDIFNLKIRKESIAVNSNRISSITYDYQFNWSQWLGNKWSSFWRMNPCKHYLQFEKNYLNWIANNDYVLQIYLWIEDNVATILEIKENCKACHSFILDWKHIMFDSKIEILDNYFQFK